jgi:hypothetical protein
VAALARKAEAVRLAPQDIEWAVSGGRLWLLQSRPSTALPVAPDIEVEPDDGGKNPPPWWLLGLLVRVVPSMRRKLRAAALAVGAGKLESVPAEWASNHRPRLRREIEQHAALDLVAPDDAGLFQYLEDLKVFYARCLQRHFTLFIPHIVGVYGLAVAGEELLGWNLQKTIGLLQGLSNTSTASTDELAALARRAGQRSATRKLLEARAPDILERVDDIDPPVAKELRQYL